MDTKSLVGSELETRGFARYRRDDVTRDLDEGVVDDALAEIRRTYATLPPDPYAPGTNRYRRYARALIVPWGPSIAWLPTDHDPVHGEVTEYYQGDNNPEYPGARRRFPAVPAVLHDNPLLTRILLFDMEQTLFVEQFRGVPLHVGVHLVKLAVNSDDEAVSSPDILHQDGEPFTFAHLIERRNVVGGVNVIAPPRCAGLRPEELRPHVLCAQFTLENPLDSYVVHDPAVSHYVSPVRRDVPSGMGERNVLLVDFTPFVPHI